MIKQTHFCSYFTNVALSASLAMAATQVFAVESQSPIRIVEPGTPSERANPAAIDTESFELGTYVGLLSVEDFNSNAVIGLSLSYHPINKVLVQANYGTSDTERANTEGTRDFNPDRTLNYFSVSAGLELFRGRSFLGKNRKYNSGIYALAGITQVDFATDTNIGVVLGVNYKSVITDWLTLDFTFKDHLVEREFQDDDKLTQNTEFSIGVNSLF